MLTTIPYEFVGRKDIFAVFLTNSAWLHYILSSFWPAIYKQACVILHMKQLLEEVFGIFLHLCANFLLYRINPYTYANSWLSNQQLLLIKFRDRNNTGTGLCSAMLHGTTSASFTLAGHFRGFVTTSPIRWLFYVVLEKKEKADFLQFSQNFVWDHIDFDITN